MARLNAFHPVRDYLNGLPGWDGTRRIATWLIDYCKVSPTVLNEKDEAVPNIFAMEAGARFLISAIARIFQPGCKADHVLMLEGKTGIGKSTTVRILAGEEYFTDQLSDLGSKDASMQIRGIWIVEIAELHALSKSDRENAKKFVSQQFELPPPLRQALDKVSAPVRFYRHNRELRVEYRSARRSALLAGFVRRSYRHRRHQAGSRSVLG
jgi:predicted P-loop ATPase